MDIGIGLPSTLPTATGADVLAWARAAEKAGFSTLGTIDRVVYGNHETIPTLAAAAAVTTRIRLTTAILIAPFRGNGALLAKQLASVDSFANGRLTVGIAVGGRPDDYSETGTDFDGRGPAFDAQLDTMQKIWSGETGIGPAPVQAGGPPLLIGGMGKAAVRRTVSHGAGYISGGGGPGMFGQAAAGIREAWTAGGRDGSPRLAALGYFALGPDAADDAAGYLGDYYAFAGPYKDMVIGGAATSDDMVREQVAGYVEAGCDELILFPCNPDIDQLHRLAEVVL